MNYKTTEQKAINFIRFKNLIKPGDKILVALSGGADSVFLLHFLNNFQKLFKISIAAAHINHSLRGKEANADQIFSQQLCDSLGIPFFTSRVYVKSFAKRNGLSIEEAARNLRYSSLNKIAKKIKADKIATAHNVDDNAETVLFNLSRGTGISGMAGIPYQRQNIIRPIITLGKFEIVEYLTKKDIPFQTDSTNSDDSFKRNFLRNQIIPSIRKNINPAFADSVFKFSEILKNYSQIIESFLNNAENVFTKFEHGTLEISLKLFDEINDSVAGEIFKHLFSKYFDVEYNFNDYLKLIDLVKNQTGKQIFFKNGLTAIRERSSVLLFVETKTTKKTKLKEIKISIGDSVETKLGIFTIKDTNNKSIVCSSNRYSEIISADNLKDIFILRRWKIGDKFIPLGMKNLKKVSDFLTEQKVSARNKKEQLVLTNGNKIVWVVGHRIDNRFRIQNNSKQIIRLWIK